MQVEQTGGVVGSVDVAADPEQRLGDAAQHDRVTGRGAGPLLLLLGLLLAVRLVLGMVRLRHRMDAADIRLLLTHLIPPSTTAVTTREVDWAPAPRCPWSRRPGWS